MLLGQPPRTIFKGFAMSQDIRMLGLQTDTREALDRRGKYKISEEGCGAVLRNLFSLPLAPSGIDRKSVVSGKCLDLGG